MHNYYSPNTHTATAVFCLLSLFCNGYYYRKTDKRRTVKNNCANQKRLKDIVIKVAL